MKPTRLFKVTGILSLAGLVLAIFAEGFPKGLGILSLVVAGSLFAGSLARYVMRRILWRVGSRLLVSYFLVGFVPLLLVGAFVFVVAAAVTGQYAGRRVEEFLGESGHALAEAVRDVELDERRVPDPKAVERLLAGSRATRQGLVPHPLWAFVPDEGTAFGPAVDAEGSPHADVVSAASEDFSLVKLRSGAGALACAPAGKGSLCLLQPLDEGMAAAVEARTGISTTLLFGETSGGEGDGGNNLSLHVGGADDQGAAPPAKASPTPPATPSAAAAPGPTPAPKAKPGPRGGPARYVVWPILARRTARGWTDGKELAKERVVVLARTSIAHEARALFSDPAGEGKDPSEFTRRLAATLLKVLGGIFGVTALVAVGIAVLLVVRIARATSRLSGGFREVEKGNFDVRLALKGEDQLSELVGGFNAMAAHLAESVKLRAEAQALERELDAARRLQRQLLPADFTFAGLSIAADFRPAAAIGGDFYQFFRLGPGRLAAVVGDVAGHGLPTGLVMASACATLAAAAGSGAEPAEVLRRLDAELRRTGEPQLFVTVAYLLLDLPAGKVSFTNAAHIYPWRVEPSGKVTALVNPARPLGVALPAEFRTVEAPLATGDSWVMVSDGIVEGQSPAGEVFGFDRVEEVLASGAGLPAEELREKVLAAWREFTGGDSPADDRTLLVIRVTGTA